MTDLENIKKVFGEDWSPSVSQDLQNKGIYGAVRVGDSNDVYTIGSGGTKLTPETYKSTFGTLDQNGIVGSVTPEQAASLGINLNATPTTVTDTIKSGLLDQQSVTSSDITNLINQRADLYKQYQATQNPTTEVTNLQNQVANIDEKISNIENSRDKGILETGQQNIAMEYITGEQQAIEQRATSILNTYNSQQKNLLTRLGYAKEAQELKQTTLSNLLSYTNDDLSIQFKIQDRIDTQLKDYQTRLDKQAEDAKDEISTIVSLYSQSGKDFNDLSEADKLSITQKAATAGLDLNLIQYGLKSAKDQYLYDQTIQQKKDALELQAQQANIAQSNASAAASRASANKKDKAEELTGLAGALDEAANDIITAEKAGAPMSSESYWGMVKQVAEAMGMTESDADKQIINTVKQKKGENVNSPGNNLGSDFVTESDILKSIANKPTVFTTPTQQAKNAQSSYAEQLKSRANALIATYRKNPYSPEGIKAKNELSTIPRTYQGITIHSGV